MKVQVTNWIVPSTVFVTTASTLAAAYCWLGWGGEVMEHKKMQLLATQREVEVKKALDGWASIQREFESTRAALADLREDKAKVDTRISSLLRIIDENDRMLQLVRDKENQTVADIVKKEDGFREQIEGLTSQLKDLEAKNEKLESFNAKLGIVNVKKAERKSQLQLLSRP